MDKLIIFLLALLVLLLPVLVASLPVLTSGDFLSSITGHAFIILLIVGGILLLSFFLRK